MPDDAILQVGPRLRLPRAELVFRATRAGGPGGQHVNTSSTRIELWWDVARSPSLDDAQRARLLEALATRVDGDGWLRLVAAGERSQLRNREAAVARFTDLVARALVPPKPRRATKVPRAAKLKRLENKRRRSAVKRERRTRPDD